MSKDACCELCGEYVEDPLICQECGAKCCSLCMTMTDKGDLCANCDKKEEEN